MFGNTTHPCRTSDETSRSSVSHSGFGARKSVNQKTEQLSGYGTCLDAAIECSTIHLGKFWCEINRAGLCGLLGTRTRREDLVYTPSFSTESAVFGVSSVVLYLHESLQKHNGEPLTHETDSWGTGKGQRHSILRQFRRSILAQQYAVSKLPLDLSCCISK